MKRWSCREIHENPRCPGALRDGLTDFLSFFVIHSGVYRPAVRKIAALLTANHGKPEVVELCSGGGLYSWTILKSLRMIPELGNAVWRLTDLYPNRNWGEVGEISGGAVTGSREPCPAADALKTFSGVFVMFSALHHFTDDELASLLRTAAANRRTVAFFDYSRREKPLLEIPAVVLSPLLMWLFGWLVHPFSRTRLALIYLFPALPALFLIDGALSRLRAFTTTELERVAASALPEDYSCETGSLKTLGGIAEIHYLIAAPRR